MADNFLSNFFIEPITKCWNWTGAINDGGYGRVNVPKIGYRYAHRVSYERYIGKIPDNLYLDHLCRNRRCVNPDHLEPVSHKENVLRGESPSARCARQIKCIHGHMFDHRNTYLDKCGKRHCRKCLMMRARKRRANSKIVLV